MAAEYRECDLCGGPIPAYTTPYTLRLQMFAEAGPVFLTPDDLHQDHAKKMREILEESKNMDPQELMDEVFESYTLTICPSCRREFHDRFKKNMQARKDPL